MIQYNRACPAYNKLKHYLTLKDHYYIFYNSLKFVKVLNCVHFKIDCTCTQLQYMFD